MQGQPISFRARVAEVPQLLPQTDDTGDPLNELVVLVEDAQSRLNRQWLRIITPAEVLAPELTESTRVFVQGQLVENKQGQRTTLLAWTLRRIEKCPKVTTTSQRLRAEQTFAKLNGAPKKSV